MMTGDDSVAAPAGLTRRALLGRYLTLATGAVCLSAFTRVGGQSSAAVMAAAVVTSLAAQATGAPAQGGTLRISQPGDILPKFAPHVSTPYNTTLTNLLYDRLVTYDTLLNVQPGLATNWQWSPDFLQLTLTLRPGVKFHTGRPFTSADVKFNLERVGVPTVNSQWLNYARAMHVAAPDPETVVISYDTSARGSFDALASVFMADSQTLDQTASGTAFVGTGPFRFQEWMQGDHLTVVRNADYWQPGKPYLDQVEVMVRSDPEAAVVGLESGAIDWVIGVPGQDGQRLQNDSDFQVMLNGNGSVYYYLGLDVSVPALSDKRVRQAFALATDRQRIVDSVLFGFGRQASTLWPRQSPAYDAALDQSTAYDLAQARQLLAAANWDPNTVVPLQVSSANAPTVAMAEILQQDLASIGMQVAVQPVDPADFVSRIQNAKFGGAWIATIGFMNTSPATLYVSAFPVRVPNTSHFESARYKELIDQSSSEIDDQQLKAELQELTRITLDEAFVVPIAEAASLSLGLEVARAGVKNITWDDLGWPDYQDISLER
jgi:peptide/nickel transport system substrate-binding protein